jgi:hypothetical protein
LFLSIAQRGKKRPTSHKDDDERTRGPQGRAHVMGLRREIGNEMKEARHYKAEEQKLRKQ